MVLGVDPLAAREGHDHAGHGIPRIDERAAILPDGRAPTQPRAEGDEPHQRAAHRDPQGRVRERRAEAARWIARYKEIRPIIQFGDLYRLRSAQQNPFSALMYVSKDQKEAVLFAFRTHQPLLPQIEPQPPLYPRGLDPQARYAVEGLDQVRSGLGWMRTGIELVLSDYQSTILHFKQAA